MSKTLEEIVEIANSRKKEITRYLQPADFNRSVAIFNFIEEIEKEAKKENKKFEIDTIKIMIANCRHQLFLSPYQYEIAKEEKLAIEFIEFTLGKYRYYIQFSSNPLFTDSTYITKDLADLYLPHEAKMYEEIFKPNIETIYRYNGKENVNKLKNDLKKIFNSFKKIEIKKTDYDKEGLKLVKGEQNIYYG